MTQSSSTSGSELPPGWTEARIQAIIAHYESQSDEEAIAEDESAYQRNDYTMMAIPLEFVPLVQELLTEFASSSPNRP